MGQIHSISTAQIAPHAASGSRQTALNQRQIAHIKNQIKSRAIRFEKERKRLEKQWKNLEKSQANFNKFITKMAECINKHAHVPGINQNLDYQNIKTNISEARNFLAAKNREELYLEAAIDLYTQAGNLGMSRQVEAQKLQIRYENRTSNYEPPKYYGRRLVNESRVKASAESLTELLKEGEKFCKKYQSLPNYLQDKAYKNGRIAYIATLEFFIDKCADASFYLGNKLERQLKLLPLYLEAKQWTKLIHLLEAIYTEIFDRYRSFGEPNNKISKLQTCLNISKSLSSDPQITPTLTDQQKDQLKNIQEKSITLLMQLLIEEEQYNDEWFSFFQAVNTCFTPAKLKLTEFKTKYDRSFNIRWVNLYHSLKEVIIDKMSALIDEMKAYYIEAEGQQQTAARSTSPSAKNSTPAEPGAGKQQAANKQHEVSKQQDATAPQELEEIKKLLIEALKEIGHALKLRSSVGDSRTSWFGEVYFNRAIEAYKFAVRLGYTEGKRRIEGLHQDLKSKKKHIDNQSKKKMLFEAMAKPSDGQSTIEWLQLLNDFSYVSKLYMPDFDEFLDKALAMPFNTWSLNNQVLFVNHMTNLFNDTCTSPVADFGKYKSQIKKIINVAFEILKSNPPYSQKQVISQFFEHIINKIVEKACEKKFNWFGQTFLAIANHRSGVELLQREAIKKQVFVLAQVANDHWVYKKVLSCLPLTYEERGELQGINIKDARDQRKFRAMERQREIEQKAKEKREAEQKKQREIEKAKQAAIRQKEREEYERKKAEEEEAIRQQAIEDRKRMEREYRPYYEERYPSDDPGWGRRITKEYFEEQRQEHYNNIGI